jgi:hypothetical protein
MAEVGYRRFVRDGIEVERRNAKKIDLIPHFTAIFKSLLTLQTTPEAWMYFKATLTL